MTLLLAEKTYAHGSADDIQISAHPYIIHCDLAGTPTWIQGVGGGAGNTFAHEPEFDARVAQYADAIAAMRNHLPELRKESRAARVALRHTYLSDLERVAWTLAEEWQWGHIDQTIDAWLTERLDHGISIVAPGPLGSDLHITAHVDDDDKPAVVAAVKAIIDHPTNEDTARDALRSARGAEGKARDRAYYDLAK